ncbi:MULTISPECIES: phosphate ABC transporter ATP-binding protein [Lacrimispora]|jgi:phosphate transport system ATP-binding protein|uniref:Phosphate ABC transporter ATP-binding protein n=1 Tax=Lacrimispora celerecrescens TaxID=29354 RepID=A0A084JNW7_9FIRM|nr:phosphate ABC transporter ATP-binding protein [Lacrimispora celerecrescens]KEZ90651.1 phosphate ABC transporter ATP-binding protein [Lacrimispora celerecrescens]MBW4847878.1 phosphate ABC transporter ATP-binding protein [Lachnospiraceae bacterium]HBC99540.1 phosphate ABC transporter ATP-binding protein [Lachnoclostridium sp.]HBG11695.1 phosphate ABC transporter ATP-binding protein [Clostridium sp.]
MTQTSKIDIKGLNFYYQQKQVIKELNLELPKNRITAVFGPANSGITTLLRTLNRLSDLTVGARHEGEILLDGKNIFDPDVNVTELRRRVGMVFDVPTSLPMSIFDNVALGPRMGGMKSKSAVAEEVEKALRMSALWDDVKDRLDTPAARLSGGQQQRLCIARVLALEPEVILLDRPCSALDPISTAKIEESLMQLKEQYTIIIAPHTVQQAGRIADRVAFMLMGDLIEQGYTQEVFSFPKDNRTNDYLTGRFG